MMTKSLLVVRNESAARECLEKLVPHYGDLLVVSLDESYPRSEPLRRQALSTLREDPAALVAVLNFDCVRALDIRSTRMIVLDDLVIDLHRRISRKEITEDSAYEWLAHSIEAYFSQFAKIERANNFTFGYGSWREYRLPVERPCLMDLLGGRRWLSSREWCGPALGPSGEPGEGRVCEGELVEFTPLE